MPLRPLEAHHINQHILLLRRCDVEKSSSDVPLPITGEGAETGSKLVQHFCPFINIDIVAKCLQV